MTDYFAFMEFPRSLTLDADTLQARYFAMSRENHPDFFAGSDEAERSRSLEMSSTLNQAYRTLRDPFERARHLLALERPGTEHSNRIPPSLLMEVMEIQEKIAEVQTETDPGRSGALRDDLVAIKARLAGTMNGLAAGLDTVAVELDRATGDDRATLLTRLQELIDTRSYLRTLLATLDAALGGERLRH